MTANSPGSELLDTWLQKTDLFSDGYDQVLCTGALRDAAVRSAFKAAFHDHPLTLHWAELYDILGVLPDPALRMRIRYLATLGDAALLDQATEDLDEKLRAAKRGSHEHAKAISSLAYARTERLICRIGRSNSSGSQVGVDLSHEHFQEDEDFCRRGLREVSSQQFPQDAGLLAYNLGRVLELRGQDSRIEAFECFLFAIWLFHGTVEEGRRIFNAPRFIPHQREFWSCLAAAIRLAAFLGRKDVAICLSQLIKYGRSPLSVLDPMMAQMQYLPDPSLFARVCTEPRLQRSAAKPHTPTHHFPPTILKLGEFLSSETAIVDMYRHEEALLVTLLDTDGIQCVGTPVSEFYQHCPSLHRLVRLTETDFSLDEGKASWIFDYPQVAIVPSPGGQWGVDTTSVSMSLPFTPGLEAFNELYGVLFKGLDQHLVSKGITKVSMSPDGTLNLVPFSALVDDSGQFLLDRYFFSYVPNLSTLLWCLSNRQSAIHSVVLVKDLGGSLALASDEINAVASLLSSADVKLFGATDSMDALVGQIADADLLHFACHGMFDVRRPECSGMFLDPYHLLPANVLSEHSLKPGSIAVLSACETAHSNVSRKYGVPGLAHAFLRAGVTTVVASLWKVPDIAAYLLMSRMYELVSRTRAGVDVVEALTLAQRWLKNMDENAIRSYGPQSSNPAWAGIVDAEFSSSKRFLSQPFRHMRALPELTKPFSNPYYWAGFIVIGDWRSRTVA